MDMDTEDISDEVPIAESLNRDLFGAKRLIVVLEGISNFFPFLTIKCSLLGEPRTSISYENKEFPDLFLFIPNSSHLERFFNPIEERIFLTKCLPHDSPPSRHGALYPKDPVTVYAERGDLLSDSPLGDAAGLSKSVVKPDPYR